MNVLSSQPPHQEGVVFYDQDTHTLTLYNDESDVALQLGQEEFLRVRNKTGATITNGTAVLIDGSYGSASPSVSGAIANSESNSQVVGIATHDIENDSFGYITTYGLVRDIDTSHYSDGDEIFLSQALIGSGSSTSPIVPNYEVRIGHCVKSHLTNGSVLVQLGSVKLGGGDLKIESSVQVSGVPFVTNLASDVAAAVQTDRFFYYDSGINRLYSTSVNVSSGVILEDGVPNSTASTLYNDGGTLKFNGSQIGSWFISDGKGHNEEITLGQYVHVSGLSGVDTYYNSDTNVLEVNPAVLSGYFNGKINTLDFFTSWEIYGNSGPASLVDDQDSIGFLGDSGVETYYNSLNKQLEINTGSLSGWANGTIVGTGTILANDIGQSGMSVSGWAWGNIDKLYTSGNAISGWANGTIVGTGNVLANDIGESGMSVSGWAWGNIDKLYTSGNAVSGWAWGNIDKLYTSGNAVSGWAEYHIFDLYTSGMAISGWAKAYADAISSAAGMTNWNVSDGDGGSESITEGATVEWVGRSGIDTYYNSTNNELEINAGSLSGWANGTIIGTGTILANDIGESGMAVSGWAAYDIDKLYTSGNAVSGWANGTIVSTGTTLANDIGESGMAISGWARGYTDANGGRTVSPSTTNNGLVTWVTSNQSFAVESGIAYGLPTSDGDNYSTAYPYAQEMTVSGRLVIADDSAQPSSKETLGNWNSAADNSGVLIVQGGATITRNLSTSGIQAHGGNINVWNIGGMGGNVYGDADCSFSGAGKFHTLKLQHSLNSFIQASGFNTDCVLTWNVNPAGGIHGEQSTLAIKEGVYVNEAIPASDTPTVEDATIALDLSRGSYHNVSLGVDVTSISFSNAQRGQRFILRITQNASAKTVSWASGPSIKWDRGLVPVMSTGGSRVDVYGFLCTNSTGTSFDGFIIGQDLQ